MITQQGQKLFKSSNQNLKIQSNLQVVQNQKMSHQAKSCAKLSMKTPNSPTTFTFSKSTLETPEQCVKSVQSYVLHVSLLLTWSRFDIILVLPIYFEQVNAC